MICTQHLTRLLATALFVFGMNPYAHAASVKKNSGAKTKSAVVKGTVKSSPVKSSRPETPRVLESPYEKLRIVGFNGDVKINFTDGTTPLSVHVLRGRDEVPTAVTMAGKTMEVTIPTNLSREDWTSSWESRSSLASLLPAYTVEVKGVTTPTEIIWKEGTVRVQGGKHPLIISALRGHVELTQTEGDVRVYLVDGQAQITGGRGRALVSSMGAGLTIKDFQGPLAIYNHTGMTQLLQTKGDVRWGSFKGPLHAQGTQGALEIRSAQSFIKVEDMEGELRGSTESGDTIVTKMKPKSSVRLETTKGDVRVRIPKSIAARVNLSTEEGRLIPPPGIRANGEGKGKSASGKLGGTEPGVVVVKSKSGTISVSQD